MNEQRWIYVYIHTYIHIYIKNITQLQKTGASQVKRSSCQCRKFTRCEFDPWVGKILWSRKWNHSSIPAWTRSLMSYSPWGCNELEHKKREWNNAICHDTDGPRDYCTEWSKPDREIKISWYHFYVESKKIYLPEFIYKTEIDSQTKKRLMVTKEEWQGTGDKSRVGD